MQPRFPFAVALAAAACRAVSAAPNDSVVTLNEIMFHPLEGAPEWVEIHNQMAVDVDLSDWRLSGGIDFAFPGGTVIPGGGYLVISASPGAGQLGPFTGRLDNGGDTVNLRNNSDRLMDSLDYGDGGRWPVAPDGSGVSLARRHPHLPGERPDSWAWKTPLGGTPGARNFADPFDEGTPATFGDETLIAFDAAWYYDESGADLGAAWFGVDPVAQGWSSGPGLLAFTPGGGGGGLPATLVGFWNFNNGADPAGSGTAPAIIQRGSGSAGQDGAFTGAAARTGGIVGAGAARFSNTAAESVNTGSDWSFTTGLTVEATFISNWTGNTLDYDEFFRKEDGGNRILLSYQNDANNGGANPPVAAGPVISFGLNTGGYQELDMPLDGQAGRPTVAQLTDGNPHHIAATYDAATGKKAIYIDGTERFSVTLAPNTPIASGGGASGTIGNDLPSGGEAFNGVLDEVALHSAALAPAAIAAHAANALAGSEYFGALPAPVGTALSDPQANAPFVGRHYFVRDFTLTEQQRDTIQQLRLRHIVDDGAIFYLNGAEVLRFNADPVSEIDKAALSGTAILPTDGLTAGANRLAVEVLQFGGAGDDDIAFGAELEATFQLTPAIPPITSEPAPPGDGVILSEIASALDAGFQVELANTGVAPVDLSGMEIQIRAGLNAATATLPNTTLNPGASLVLGEADLGFEAAAGDRLFLFSAGRSDLLDAAEVKARAQARLDGAQRTDPFFTPSAATFGAANAFAFEDGVVISEIMYHHRPDFPVPSVPAVVVLEPVITFGQAWRYNDSGADLGSGWAGVAHPVGGGWAEGTAAIGYEPAFSGTPDTPLIQTLHYSDTFTITSQGGIADRPGGGAYPVNAPGINVENSHGNAARAWTNGKWSINEDANVSDPGGVFAPGSGTATGMTQTGSGVDFGIEYGLADHFTVAFDCFQPDDRVDITAAATRDAIAGGLAVFFRRTGHPTLPEIGLYNGSSEIDSELTSGIASANGWHNYAVRFDLPNHLIEVYVDNVSRGIVDLAALNGGSHDTASNAAVSVGATAATGGRAWTDNFQVGTPNVGVIGTELADPQANAPFITTYYFEREFTLTADQVANLSAVEIRHRIDDGAVFYLNGTEVARYNMPEGAVTAATLATLGIGDASVGGPIGIDKALTNLVAGTNRLSCEVHQAALTSSDILFDAALDLVEEISPELPGSPLVESGEEWIELYNRGAGAIDLTGARLDGGIGFDFADGTVLAPGEYAVVAKDAAALAAKYPAIRVLGEFSGSLNNASDRLVLEDAARNPMDAVEYFDGGLWASAADGEGSSLELVDAAADNAMPQAWAASDESAKSAWQTFSYRARGNAFPGTNDPAGYHEFLFGLLDAGEFLIDDISVVEDPDGAARQLIQNGGFEGDALGAIPAAWRLLGTHGEHGRSVVADDGAGGKALRVAATGPAWHQNNLAETTLKDGAAFAAIDPSADYEISFRARWLAGSPQLNTRLYFDRAARTHLLPMPALAGTPGAPNSRAVANLGPIVSRVAHSPIHPAPGEPVTITAAIADPADGVASAKVWWSTGTGFSEIAMAAAGDHFTASIPGQSSGATVQFYIEAEDGGGAASVFPPGGADSRALYRVGAPGDASGDLHRIEVLMTAADEALLTRATSLMSDHRYGGTAIYENEVFYDIGVRLKGSQRGRTDVNRLGISLSFAPHHKFRGAHDSIGLDRSGGWRFGRTFGQDEILVHHVLAKAGGIPSMYNDLIYLDGPAAAAGTAQLQLARYEDVYLASQFDGGDQGSVHNYELIYHPLTTNTGGPEGVKLPNPDAVNGVPLRDLGPDTEAYRYYFALGNRRDADDYAGMIRLCETFSQGGAAFDAAIGDAIDVDQWLRAYAAVSLCGVSDSYFNGSNAHNARFFQRPADGRMLLFPWDMDFAFMPGEQSAALRRNADVTKLTADPARLRLFYGHAHDIMDRAFNAAYFGPWAAHYGALLPGQDFASLTSFVSARAAAAAAECNAAIPPVGFAFTTPGGGSVPGQSAALEGTGWVNVREIRIAGQSAPLAVEWTSADDWRVQVPLAIGANSITLEAYDFQGNLIGTDTVDVTGTATIEPASAANLAITEIHYHPAAPTQAELDAGHGDQDLFEFVELRNIGANPVDLTGVAFTDGIAFGFTGSDVTQLAPGGYALVVSHRAAFELRYLAGLPVAGQYSGNLSNGGEALEIADALGNPIAALTYGDAAPWPAAADGEGPSLEIIDALGDESDPANWRASDCPGGTPAAYHAVILAAWKALHFTEAELLDEDISGDLADPDRDQIPNIAEHAFGTDPRAPDAHLAPSVALGGEFLEISVRVPQAAIGAKVRYEISGDLLGWQGAAFAESARTDNGDGTDQVTLRIAAPEGPAFIRAAISVPQ